MMRQGLLAFAWSGLLVLVWATSGVAAPTYVGAARCRTCHKVQHDSWLKTRHATNDPKVDCELCHGPGSDYKAMAIMRDPVRSKAAGLIAKPDKASCVAKCHKDDWKDELLAKSHAHRVK